MSDRAEQLSRLPPAALAIYAAELEEASIRLLDAYDSEPWERVDDARNKLHALLSKYERTGK